MYDILVKVSYVAESQLSSMELEMQKLLNDLRSNEVRQFKSAFMKAMKTNAFKQMEAFLQAGAGQPSLTLIALTYAVSRPTTGGGDLP